MKISETEEKALREFVDELRKRFGNLILETKLFGSKARGKSETFSDIDVFILVKNFDWDLRFKISEIANDISIKYDVLISDIVFSFEEMNNRVIKSTPFIQNIEREGIPL